MGVKELYNDLVEAYSNDNLNKITGQLIWLYKNKNYGKIREIANKISKYVPIDEEKDAKCFSKLIMLYHPDKGEQFRKTIQELYEQNDYENLKKHSYILMMAEIDDITVTATNEDVDYNPEYAWDANTNDGFSTIDSDGENDSKDYFETDDYEKSFYNMIKIREYGNLDVEFPSYYLEDFEEFEMAYSGLESLDGVEHCMHVKILDISNNAISDLENLWDLKCLEELYLANNQIGYIDALSNLIHLKVLDLSGNQIDDISPILNLENLEFVNLIGNSVSDNQIEKLKSKGMILIHHKRFNT